MTGTTNASEIDAARTPEAGRLAGRGSRAREMVVGCVAVAAVMAVYVFIVSAGHVGQWPSYTSFNDMQAEGFRSGHLYLIVQPSPELLAQPDPFDDSNRPLWLWDASLHDGHFYLYWGPVPSVLLAIVKTLLRLDRPVGDEALAFGFAVGRAIFGALLIVRLSRRLFDASPSWIATVSIVVFGLASPLPFMMARAAVYETAILGGQCFLVAGLLAALLALSGRPVRSLPLATSGSCWALAVGCRLSLAPCVAGLALATAVAAWRLDGAGDFRKLVRRSALVGVPLAVGIASLALFNHARFGSWQDSGLGSQLTTKRFVPNLSNVVANVYSYWLRDVAFSCHFPFVTAPRDMGPSAFPAGFSLAAGYDVHDPVAGLVRAAPWVLLAIPALIWPALVVLRRRAGNRLRSMPEPPRVIGVWCVCCLGLAATVSAAVPLGLWTATMRYAADASAVQALGAVGACLVVVWSRRTKLWPAVAVATVALAGYTVIVGALLGVTGYYQHFKKHNPELFASFGRMDVCGKP